MSLKKDIRVPDIVFVLNIHESLIGRYGGTYGLTNIALLESALSRPHNVVNYSSDENLDIFDLAATLCYGMAKNHAFMDGNKRTALITSFMFMVINQEKNGSKIFPNYEGDIVKLMEDLVQDNITKKKYANVFRKNV